MCKACLHEMKTQLYQSPSSATRSRLGQPCTVSDSHPARKASYALVDDTGHEFTVEVQSPGSGAHLVGPFKDLPLYTQNPNQPCCCRTVARYSNINLNVPMIGMYSLAPKIHLDGMVIARTMVLMMSVILATGLPAAMYSPLPFLQIAPSDGMDLPLPGIDNGNARVLKVIDVPRGHGKTVRHGDGCYVGVWRWRLSPGLFCVGKDLGQVFGSLDIESQRTVFEQTKRLFDFGAKRVLALTVWQAQHAETELSIADGAQVESLGGLAVQPLNDFPRRLGLKRLGEDVGIEQDHLKSAPRISFRSRITSRSSMPPISWPIRKSAVPIFMRSCGR